MRRAAKAPASTVLAAALAANPAELKRLWLTIGEDLTRAQFAYLLSHFLGGERADERLEGRPQAELLAGAAELFTEAIVSQADKTMVSWRAFSQALVSATLAAGRPPRIATEARVACARVAIDNGANGANGRAVSSFSAAAAAAREQPSLSISAETVVIYLPRPLHRLLVCESRSAEAVKVSGGARHRISLWQVAKGKIAGSSGSSGGNGGSGSGGGGGGRNDGSFPYGAEVAQCVNVLLEHGPQIECAALVPTINTLHRGILLPLSNPAGRFRRAGDWPYASCACSRH